LKQLNKKFNGDWLLALASYNVGPGNVQKAIRKNGELGSKPDYWSLDLPRETREYVPKLLAIAKLFANAEKYNLPLHPIPNHPFLKAVHIDSQLDLTKAAELAGMPLEEFLNLNPGFNHAITAPHGSYKLLIQVNKAAAFKRKLAQLPKGERVKWLAHTVKAGEDLNAVAKFHGVSVDTLLVINGLTDVKVAAGSVLRIPPESVKALKVV
jgi:membrane-bound lytic murein transglycosylase D